MCFTIRIMKPMDELQRRYGAEAASGLLFQPGDYSGFDFPRTPVITSAHPQELRLLSWGLIPGWSKDEGIRSATLNARVETYRQKPAFRGSAANRCLVLADGFYEWQWLDPKGRRKQKYLLQLAGSESFAFAGLWSDWTDPHTGAARATYTILTTEANGLMSTIHNSKKRMPAIVGAGCEQDWLAGRNIRLANDLLYAEQV